MYMMEYTDGVHETFGCLGCGRTFVSREAIGRHFERNPAHGEVTITGSHIEQDRTPDDLPRGVARRRVMRRLHPDALTSGVGMETDTDADIDSRVDPDVDADTGIDRRSDDPDRDDSSGASIESDGDPW